MVGIRKGRTRSAPPSLAARRAGRYPCSTGALPAQRESSTNTIHMQYQRCSDNPIAVRHRCSTVAVPVHCQARTGTVPTQSQRFTDGAPVQYQCRPTASPPDCRCGANTASMANQCRTTCSTDAAPIDYPFQSRASTGGEHLSQHGTDQVVPCIVAAHCLATKATHIRPTAEAFRRRHALANMSKK